MTLRPQTGSGATEDAVRSEMDSIRASEAFKRSGVLSRFLMFVCEETLAGRAERLKEYTIAVEALGRPASFQPREDPVVRVNAIRLRKALREFYRTHGRDHTLRIALPKGGYVPEFRPNGDGASAGVKHEDAAPNSSSTLGSHEPQRPRASLSRRGRRRVVTAGIAACLAVALVALAAIRWKAYGRPRPTDAPAVENDRETRAPGLASAGGETAVRILAGSTTPFVDRMGRVWSADRFFSGGHVETTLFEPNIRVEDREVWRRYRAGDVFEYAIPLPPGVYELRLYFAEPVFGVDELRGGGETSRVFDVFANGHALLTAFDVLSDAGGARTADVKVFTGISPDADGALHLRFAGQIQAALLNALEIVPGLPGRMRPIRIAARDTPFLSRDHRLFEPDRYFTGGRLHPLWVPAQGTDDPGLYATERFGNFTYALPVAEGRYTLVLHFSEGFFGLPGLAVGGKGSRVFDISCNGAVLEKGLDVFDEAGGAARALRKEYHGLRASPLGKIVLSFQPGHNYACLNALELLSEGP